MTTVSTEYFRGFSWAIPTAFAECLNQCCFQPGDRFYDNADGYGRWADAVQQINYSLQVRSVTSTTKPTGDKVLFEQNWKSQVSFSVTDHKTKDTKHMTSTAGRLFTLLWKGDWEVFNCESEPPVPLTWADVSRKTEAIAFEAKQRLAVGMEKPNVFVMAFDPTNPVSASKCQEVRNRLQSEFTVLEKTFSPSELGLSAAAIVPTVEFVGFAIDLGASAKVSDALKQVLYKPTTDSDVDRFKLSHHGTFLPSHVQNFGDVVTISLKHGPTIYRYRLYKPRLACVPPELKDYLNSVTVDCPTHFFDDPPFCSNLGFQLPIKPTRVRTHPITDLAGDSFSNRKYKSTHENVQMHLIEKDPETIAAEIPVWAEPNELLPFEFTGNLTGHIDLLRVSKDGMVEIWDYKPAAFEEVNAATQIFFYAVLLSIRTKVPLSQIRCGYFDASDAFMFEPCQWTALSNVSKRE